MILKPFDDQQDKIDRLEGLRDKASGALRERIEGDLRKVRAGI